ncbi:MAG: hypothetical protein RLY87_646 [Chloroflexota bacterium]
MNPVLQKMGYGPHDRVVIVHADDIGMCQASTGILPRLFSEGALTAGSLMAPCAWFPAAAQWAAANPQADLGVHFTLTCEWDVYRWPSLTGGATLHDDEGYQYRSMAAVFAAVSRADAHAEIAAQYARARRYGMIPTHFDSHMGTMFGAATLESYVAISQQTQTPAFLVRLDEARLRAGGFDAETAAYQVAHLATLEAAGVPLCDHMRWLDLGNPAQGIDDVKELFSRLPAGLSYVICHPAADTPELRAIAPDWQSRVRDYAVMTNPGLRRHIEAQGIHLIGWRAVQQALVGSL